VEQIQRPDIERRAREINSGGRLDFDLQMCVCPFTGSAQAILPPRENRTNAP
jgi:hypothetical protein